MVGMITVSRYGFEDEQLKNLPETAIIYLITSGNFQH